MRLRADYTPDGSKYIVEQIFVEGKIMKHQRIDDRRIEINGLIIEVPGTIIETRVG